MNQMYARLSVNRQYARSLRELKRYHTCMKNGPGGSTWLTDELFDLLVEMQGASHFAAYIAAVKLACV